MTEKSEIKTAGAERRAVWFSYLDWQQFETGDAESFRASVEPVLDNCLRQGINTVILQVRPFADAIYPSRIFPWSQLLTGVQGRNPGYDPLEIFLEKAHQRGMRLEAWINPYRIKLNPQRNPGSLAPDHPAQLHPQWAKEAMGGLYFDPALPQVRDLVVEGITELMENYPLDGIHFDDYFYPTDAPEFDAESYETYGNGMDLYDWRRENVNKLIRRAYQAVKAVNPDAEFGISPQASLTNNYYQQYSDVAMWLANPGYADYIMPQTYWGFAYQNPETGERFGFRNITQEWAQLERAPQVELYFGLGPYRIGEGDGSPATREEWNSGHNLADMVKWLRSMGMLCSATKASLAPASMPAFGSRSVRT